MRIVWIGFHFEGREAFHMVRKYYDLVACIGLKPEEASKRSGVYNYRKACEQHNIPFYNVKNINDPDSVSLLGKLKPELLIVLGWSQVLSATVLSLPSIGSIGAHASLLPTYRGSAPVNWALINGVTTTGNSLIWLEEEVDAGKVIDQVSFPIEIYDNCKSIYQKVAMSNRMMLKRSLPQIIQKGKMGYNQEETVEMVLPRRKASDGLINFSQEPIRVYNFIRALTRPYPGAFTFYEGKKIFIWRSAFMPGLNGKSESGCIHDFLYSDFSANCGISVGCLNGKILITEIEVDKEVIEGKKLHEFVSIGKKFENE